MREATAAATPTHLAALPVLGVGASLSLGSRPDPVALVNAQGGPSFVEYAGRVDIDEGQDQVQRVLAAGARVLFHPSYINFCGSYENHANWLEETARHIATVRSPWFAQDCAYCFWGETQGYSSQLGYFIPPILNENSLSQAVARVREVQALVPVPVAVEPPPMAFVVGSMPLFEFFGSLAEQTDCAILLDVGHLVSYEMASGQRVLDHLPSLAVARVIEVHIAGGRLAQVADGPVYIDEHERPILDDAFRMLEALLPSLPNLKALCFECEGAEHDDVLPMLARLRNLVRERSSNPALVSLVSGA
jgi:uncharacterized protein (UPF0276 family)